jgi:hypothetical protein
MDAMLQLVGPKKMHDFKTERVRVSEQEEIKK